MKQRERMRNISRDAGVLASLKSTRLGKTYIAYLKRYSFIRTLTAYVWRHTYPVYAKYMEARHKKERYLRRSPIARDSLANIWGPVFPIYLKYVKHRRNSGRQGKWKRLVKARDFLRGGAAPSKHLIFSLREASLCRGKPLKIHSSRNIVLEAGPNQYEFPEIYCARVSRATVYGATNMVFLEDHVIYHDLYDAKYDYTSEEMHRRLLIAPWMKRAKLLHEDSRPRQLALGATFVDACAVNYAHWLTEVLPRVALFCEEKEFEATPIIVDAGLHENIMESLRAVVGDNREIIALGKGRALQVEQLLIVSVCGYVPFEPRKKRGVSRSHGMFSLDALESVRQVIYSRYALTSQSTDGLKIYIKRNSSIRNIINIDQVEAEFSRAGYCVIEPEKLTFEQQVRVFSRADVIVGPAGAALANAIFARKGARVGIFISVHKNMLYGYWPNIMLSRDIEVSYIMGESQAKRGVHDDFRVPVKSVSEFILRANG